MIIETGFALFFPTMETPVFRVAVSNTAYLSPEQNKWKSANLTLVM